MERNIYQWVVLMPLVGLVLWGYGRGTTRVVRRGCETCISWLVEIFRRVSDEIASECHT